MFPFEINRTESRPETKECINIFTDPITIINPTNLTSNFPTWKENCSWLANKPILKGNSALQVFLLVNNIWRIIYSVCHSPIGKKTLLIQMSLDLSASKMWIWIRKSSQYYLLNLNLYRNVFLFSRISNLTTILLKYRLKGSKITSKKYNTVVCWNDCSSHNLLWSL